AGLLLRSYDRLRQVQPGFDPHGVVAVDVALPYVRYRDYEAVKAFYQRLIERLGEIPGVVAAGATTDLPLDAPEGCSSIFLENVPLPPGREPDCVPVRLVTPGYFQAMGIRVEGRAPSWSDVEHRAGEVVVTRALARRLWPGENPMGKGLKGNGGDPPFYHVVGVTGDVRELGLDKPPVEAVYFPMLPMPGTYLWSPPRFMSVVVRAPGVSEQQLGNVIRRALAEVDPLVPVAKYRSMDAVVRQSMVRVSLTMMLLGIAAAMALVLSAVGLYGVISYVVGERRSEIGIRMALGASGPNVRRMVMMQSARLAAAGVLIGVAGALATTRVLRSLLFEVSAGDPITLGAAGLLLVAIAAVASWFPARRAARVDPMEVLRAE
ncbi:MAG TPA: FtsX-like permease family protein, partial [Gemmatimonadaceae bacterium]